MKTQNIAVNLLWLRSGQVGGSQEYLVRQLLGVKQNHEFDDQFAISLFARRGFTENHSELAQVFHCVESPSDRGSRFVRIAFEQTWLAQKTNKFDLVHHGGGTMPRFGGSPTVLTMHDVQYLSFPENFSQLRLSYLKAVVPSSLKRATVVTTPSEYVRQRLVEVFDLSPEKVCLVRHGVDSSLGQNATSEAELRQRLGLGSSDVIFLPAITHPHKNHKFLIQLMASQWTDKNLLLVIAGGKGRAEDDLMRQVRRNNLDRRVIRIGRVCDADRDGLIKLAKALVFPSLYEGFGAPVLEAMALGTPVIASDCAALPEVISNAGLVLPLDIDCWANALQLVESNRDALVAAGKIRAAQFSGKNSGSDLIAAYKRAL